MANCVYNTSDDSIYRIVLSKNIELFNMSRYSKISGFNTIAIFSTDSSLHCMTGEKDYKSDELMMS